MHIFRRRRAMVLDEKRAACNGVGEIPCCGRECQNDGTAYHILERMIKTDLASLTTCSMNTSIAQNIAFNMGETPIRRLAEARDPNYKARR